MKVLILAGGLGTRLTEETTLKPKPMVDIGHWPILWHIMNIYAHAGHKEFIVALGYKGEIIKEYFLNYYHLRNNFTVSLEDGRLDAHGLQREDWKIHLVDTGDETGTGGRIRRLKDWIGKETFLMTYGDGLSNINIPKLIECHKNHGKLATITAVRPPARFGSMEFDGDLVTKFIEKPQIGEGWINGGFFVLEPKVLDYINSDETMFEREPLERLAKEKQLAAYRHDDFWQCMDTLRDVRLLDTLWKTKEAPWKIWQD